MHKNKHKWFCIDCGRDTKHEHYFVNNDIWFNLAGMQENGMLCIGCLESRIGRRLTSIDFTDCFLNDPKRNTMSDRLRSRVLDRSQAVR